MTRKQRFFYLIGVYTFCGFLRIVIKQTASTSLERIEKAKRKAEAEQLKKDVIDGYPVDR